MQFGAPIPWAGKVATPENLIRVGKVAEALGYHFVSVGDHLVYPQKITARYPYSKDGTIPIDPTAGNLEIFTALAFVASHTSRLTLRAGLVVLPYRSPFVTAKVAATLDHLSKGRLVLGVGVGWLRDEFDILKIPWDRRGEITDEYIQVIRALCSKTPSFRGKYYEFQDVYLEPKPVQSPLPIWIGGTSQAAIRRVARLGDGWFPSVIGPEDVRTKRATLRELLRAEGKDEKDIHISGELLIQFGPTPLDTPGRSVSVVVPKHKDRVLEAIEAWSHAGAQSINVRVGDFSKLPPEELIERMQWFAEEVMVHYR